MVLSEDTTGLYDCFIEKREINVILLTNNTGGALTQRQLIMIEGFFGMVQHDSADGDPVALDIGPGIEIQSSDLKAGDTFAASGGAAPAWVYWDSTLSELSDTATSGYYRVGRLTQAKGANDFIKFIPDWTPELVP